ncbi:DNA polymerase III subunit gamma/tau [candidate division KSB1 bacterium]|nr:DNA polymerase III subunit gamma/tau [candidate division KSB1 bacterium]
MSYQVLARKYRPQTFDEVVGQEHVTRTLKNALRQGRLAHAFLFTGPRGVGKTSTARILARAVNCPNIDLKGDAEPCNVCETCRALFEDRELDVIEMDAATYNGVDDVRRINDSCRLAPVAGNRKIYIIDEVHMFSKPAFNAFLKTLEEPPSHVIFILATTDVQKVPATIRSRVQRFDFRPLGPADIAPHLKKICDSEGWANDEEAMWIIARAGAGSLRDAEGLLDQVVSFSGGTARAEETREVLGVLPTELLADTTSLLARQAVSEVPPFFELLVQRGVEYTEFLRALQGYWLDIVFLKQNLELSGTSPEEIEQMKACSAPLAIEDMFRLIRLAEQLEDSLKWSMAPRERFEVSFLRWTTLENVVTLRELIEAVAADRGGASRAPGIPDSGQVETPAAAKSAPAPATGPSPLSRGDNRGVSESTDSGQVKTPAAAKSAPAPATGPSPLSRGDNRGVSEIPDSGQVETPAAAASEPLSLSAIQSAWPELAIRLTKLSPVAGASAGGWQAVELNGTKLTVRCHNPREMAQAQLKEQLPNLARILSELFGTALTVAMGRPLPESAEKLVAQTPPLPPVPPAEGGDLFSNFVNRIGGVEVDPKTVREPK